MSKLLTVDEALTLVEQYALPGDPIKQPLEVSLGQTLAEDIASDIDSPPHDKAMMDGFAVRSADGEQARRIVEDVFAGDVPTRHVGRSEATRIMTGAPVPDGADAVVPIERVELSGDAIRPLQPLAAGKHIMPRGEAMRAGQVVLRAGESIRAAQVALLAEVGQAQVSVFPKPRVAVLATGAELVAIDQTPGQGQIRNSNGPMLTAAVSEAGGTAIQAGVATDDADALREAVASAGSAEVLLLSGGVSAGDRDLVPGVLKELGVERLFHKVAVKPGKPIWFGVWNRTAADRPTYVFGLPGNPVSSYVCFQLFVRPLLRCLAGSGFCGLPCQVARLTCGLSHRGGRETYLPARLTSKTDQQPAVEPVAWRGSADLAGFAAANALLRLPQQASEFSAGESVTVLLLPS